ncbi:MAG: hypothetical protein ACT4PL_08865, partial [Phycisphaerales bacterium]
LYKGEVPTLAALAEFAPVPVAVPVMRLVSPTEPNASQNLTTITGFDQLILEIYAPRALAKTWGEEVVITVSSTQTGDDETFRIASYGTAAKGSVVYKSAGPFTLNGGAEGAGKVTILGVEFSNGGFTTLNTKNGDTVTFSAEGVAPVVVTVYDSYVQKKIAADMASFDAIEPLLRKLLEDPRLTKEDKESIFRKIRLIENARIVAAIPSGSFSGWTDYTRMFTLDGYISLIETDPREWDMRLRGVQNKVYGITLGSTDENQMHIHAQARAKEVLGTRFLETMRDVTVASYQIFVSFTGSEALWILATDTDAMGGKVDRTRRILAGVETLANFAALGAGAIAAERAALRPPVNARRAVRDALNSAPAGSPDRALGMEFTRDLEVTGSAAMARRAERARSNSAYRNSDPTAPTSSGGSMPVITGRTRPAASPAAVPATDRPSASAAEPVSATAPDAAVPPTTTPPPATTPPPGPAVAPAATAATEGLPVPVPETGRPATAPATVPDAPSTPQPGPPAAVTANADGTLNLDAPNLPAPPTRPARRFDERTRLPTDPAEAGESTGLTGAMEKPPVARPVPEAPGRPTAPAGQPEAPPSPRATPDPQPTGARPPSRDVPEPSSSNPTRAEAERAPTRREPPPSDGKPVSRTDRTEVDPAADPGTGTNPGRTAAERAPTRREPPPSDGKPVSRTDRTEVDPAADPGSGTNPGRTAAERAPTRREPPPSDAKPKPDSPEPSGNPSRAEAERAPTRREPPPSDGKPVSRTDRTEVDPAADPGTGTNPGRTAAERAPTRREPPPSDGKPVSRTDRTELDPAADPGTGTNPGRTAAERAPTRREPPPPAPDPVDPHSGTVD